MEIPLNLPLIKGEKKFKKIPPCSPFTKGGIKEGFYRCRLLQKFKQEVYSVD